MRRLFLLLAILLLPAGPAQAATGLGGVSVAPASIDAHVRAGTELPSVHVTNDTGRAVDVRALVVPATQDLSGLPAFDLGARSRRDGRTLMRISPRRFMLPAGATRSVRATVLDGAPRVGTASYGVLVVEAVPSVADAGKGPGSTVDSRLRLTSNLLLRYPAAAAARRTADALALRAEQGALEPTRTLRFVATVANPGRIHVKPTAVLRVRDARGRLVTRASLPTGNVLPGAERELPVVVRRQLPAGRYTARVVVRAGRRRTHATTAFELVAPNTLPTPRLRIGALAPPDDATTSAVRARLEIFNRGTAAGRPAGEAILATTGGRILARRPLRMATIPASHRAVAELRLPGVAHAPHRLTVRLLDGDRELDSRTVVFTPGTAAGAWTRLLDWCAAHVPLLFAAFGLVLLTVLVGGTAYVHRLRTRLVRG